jgi:hypothetical protein
MLIRNIDAAPSKHGLTDQPDRRLIAVIAVSTEDTWAVVYYP